MKEAVLALAAAWLVIEPSAAVAFDIVQITNNSTTDGNPAISGSNVVWTQCDGSTHFACSGGDLEIYFWDGSFPIVPIQITNNSGHDSSPAISGSNMAWRQCDVDDVSQCDEGDTEIYFWDGSFPIVPTRITDNSINDTNPAISGSKVVWVSYEDILPITATDLYFWDGSFPITPIHLAHNDPPVVFAPDISGSTVVWNSLVDGASEIFRWDGSFPIEPTVITDNDRGEGYPAISGSNVVWEHHGEFDYEIYFWDGIITTNISNNSSNHEEFPDISGSIVVWQSCFWDAYIGCVDDREIYMASIPVAPVPAISFGGLALLAGLVLGTAVWATRRQWT